MWHSMSHLSIPCPLYMWHSMSHLSISCPSYMWHSMSHLSMSKSVWHSMSHLSISCPSYMWHSMSHLSMSKSVWHSVSHLSIPCPFFPCDTPCLIFLFHVLRLCDTPCLIFPFHVLHPCGTPCLIFPFAFPCVCALCEMFFQVLQLSIDDVREAFMLFEHPDPPLRYRLWRLSAIRVCAAILLDQPAFQVGLFTSVLVLSRPTRNKCVPSSYPGRNHACAEIAIMVFVVAGARLRSSRSDTFLSSI